ncbi:hypothetical protein L1987_65122 [Smallanthus sonchifolius]|uniref:Uncharacterized protein n=1 Tax=Smallanthus sonchifolius TaxID=185202 RepID=A0ACB9BTK3_9ASTR|nr:hypothetical protein L1987_65122 [Smallanthus sonchifolius]
MLSGKIEKLKNSHFVVKHYKSVVRQVNGLGLATNVIPPPVSGKFINGLIDIDLSCLDESSSQDDSSNKDDSSSKADSASDEFFSDEGSENTNSEGVISEELIGEHKVVKNIVTNRDNCILTKPETVDSNDKLKLMLYGDFQTIKPVPDLDHLGKKFHKNINKYYTQGPCYVHQTTIGTPKAESSASKCRELYRRIHKDKQTCFHYSKVGHILVNCPDKNQGKWKIVPQQAASPRTPLAKSFVPKREKKLAKPSVSISGSTPTGEKSVVKLSKPQRRGRNKRLRKQEQLAGSQPGEASTSSPGVDEDKPSVPGYPKGTISNRWYVDSGCSRQMTGNMALLQDVKPFRGGYVAFAGEKGGSITCQGVVTSQLLRAAEA